MKKLITSVILLSALVRVSAFSGKAFNMLAPIHQSVVKIFTPVLRSDSSTILVNLTDNYQTDSIKSALTVNHSDSLKILATLYCMASPKLSEVISSTPNLGSSPIANYADSLRFIASVYGSVNNKLSAALSEHDSLRIANRIENLQLVTAVYGTINAKLSSAIDQQDSIRLAEVAHLNNLKQRLKFMSADSLKHELKINKFEELKLPLYTELASRYLKYDTISNKRTRLNYQNEAITYTMMALHKYSRFNDTTGLRTCFNNLAKVYFDQKKHSQAKWFILQSNTLSRIKKDTLNIIASLVTLSSIKVEIKDYMLAMRDLNEALRLSIKIDSEKVESGILKNIALLYSRLKNYPMEATVLKTRDSLEEKIRKDEEARIVANITAQDSTQAKKVYLLQNKKKVYTSNTKKLYKSNSSRKSPRYNFNYPDYFN